MSLGATLGLFGSDFGLTGILPDRLFSRPPAAEINNFRVYVGQIFKGDKDDRSTGGDAPALAGWDVTGTFMSQDTPDGITKPKIEAGTFKDYQIIGGQEIDYLSVVRTGNDGICIHLITGKSANVGRRFAWNGDFGKACGAPWYPQPASVGDPDEKGRGFFPACIWIDGNGDSGHNFKGFNLHLGSFNGGLDREDNEKLAQAWGEDRDLLCKSEPRFSLYEDIEIGMPSVVYAINPTMFDIGTAERRDAVLNKANWVLGDSPRPGQLPPKQSGRTLISSFICTKDQCPPTGGSFEMDLEIQKDFTRRTRRRDNSEQHVNRQNHVLAAIKKRQEAHVGRLVITRIPQHSAVDLCSSASSLGPDLVSVAEGMFCDMSEKKLWPVCIDSTTSHCFDMENETVRDVVALQRRGPSSSSTNLTSTQDTRMVTQGSDAKTSIPVKLYKDVRIWDS